MVRRLAGRGDVVVKGDGVVEVQGDAGVGGPSGVMVGGRALGGADPRTSCLIHDTRIVLSHKVDANNLLS